jgi:hypothetical protein
MACTAGGCVGVAEGCAAGVGVKVAVAVGWTRRGGVGCGWGAKEPHPASIPITSKLNISKSPQRPGRTVKNVDESIEQHCSFLGLVGQL